MMGEIVGERFAEFDRRRRAEEAELAEAEELDDLADLTAVERQSITRGEDDDDQQAR